MTCTGQDQSGGRTYANVPFACGKGTRHGRLPPAPPIPASARFASITANPPTPRPLAPVSPAGSSGAAARRAAALRLVHRALTAVRLPPHLVRAERLALTVVQLPPHRVRVAFASVPHTRARAALA